VPAEALSAVIAHELNNIAVPLRGFVDLALQTTAADDPVRHSLDELHVGLDRIGMLAFQLESLAQQSSTLSPTTIGACLAETPQQLVWSCSQLTPVTVDMDHVRRSLISLLHLAGPGPLLIGESAGDGLACAACEKPFARGKVLEIQARGVRPAIFAAIGAPFGASQKLRTMQRLAIASLSHCVHLAGGHVIAHSSADSLGIVLPK
jgi:hypothetical protein